MERQTVLIQCQDSDFSSVLADHASRELDVEVKTLSANEDEGPYPVLTIAGAPPYKLQEILHQIKGLLLNAEEAGWGDYQYSTRMRQISHKVTGKAVDLTDKEAQLLIAIAESGKKGISRDELLKRVWGIEAELNTHTLETHIYRLRAKLKELDDKPVIAATEGGYKLEV